MAADQPTREPLAVDTDPLDVLLVDDNDHWVRFISQDLEATDPTLSTHTASSPNEAMIHLQETDIDCIVADYQLPEVDGLDLLARVRTDYPDCPYILVTSEGSEDVAASAIDAGVSDYLVKDTASDWVAVLASRISRAVDQVRLQRTIKETERRYRLVTEQSSDAVVIVQDDQVVFCNQRFIDLTGRRRSWIESTGDLTSVVHDDDRVAVGSVLNDWLTGIDSRHRHEVRIQTTAGEIHHCEYTGQRIPYGGEPAVLVSIRDITDRKERERELSWQRDLNQRLETVLIAANTREEMEVDVVDVLVEFGYDLAWIGALENGTLVPRAQAGHTEYLSAVDHGDETSADSEPSLWAAHSRDSRVIPNLETLFSTNWRDTALEYGFGATAAIPLSYNDLSYGVLTVYHADSGRFGDTERRLLTGLAEQLAFAIHTVETTRAFTTDQALEVVLRLTDDDYYLHTVARTLGRGSDAPLKVLATLRHADDTVLQYLHITDDSETVRRLISSQPDVVDVSAIDTAGANRFQVVLKGPTPETRLMDRGIVIRSSVVSIAGVELVVELPTRTDLRALVTDLQSRYADVSVVSITTATPPASTSPTIAQIDLGHLTDKQATALKAAYYHGYFETPRASSATDIATELGVTHSTFLQHLRAAQRKLFSDLYD